jgi:DNA-binding beta-propeller fold protein YncE
MVLSSNGRAIASGELFVTTTNYEISGSTSRMEMEPPWNTVLDEYTLHSNAVVRTDGLYVHVLNRFGADNVLVLDATNDYGVVTQYSVTGTGRNPRDLVVTAPGRAYISLYESNVLLIVDPLSGTRLGTVDLSVFADADGLAEVDQLERLGSYLFVSVQRRRRDAGWIAAGGSGVVVVDTRTDTIVDANPLTPPLDLIEVGYENPFWRMEFDPVRKRLLVLCSGDFLSLDGALVEINPFTLLAEPALIDEAALGGDLLDFALVSSTLGYALVGELDFDTCLVSFDPSSGTRLSTVYCTNGFLLNDLELDRAGNLYVGDRTANDPGIRVFDATTGQAVAGPIDVGLPPFDFVPLEPAVTSTGETTAALRKLSAWPNPFNPRVQIQMKVESEATTIPPLHVHDVRGRRITTLFGRREGGLLIWEWDGRNDAGEAVSSGRYWARPSDGSAEPVALTLVR